MTALRLPKVYASSDDSTLFVARPADQNETGDVDNDIGTMTSLFQIHAWQFRGDQIRNGNDRAQCIGNLSLALSQIGPVASSSNQGASGALSLLPTAGALIGAPAKELWVLYKLMPLAGVFSMILSLGGNIVPMDSADYEVSNNAFSYAGLIAPSKETIEKQKMIKRSSSILSAGEFAEKVAIRAETTKHELAKTALNIPIRILIMIGIGFQFFWFGILLFACGFTQSGGVITWWCLAWGWMWLWYLMVAASSLLENFAGVPFTEQWTIRVSKTPRIIISNFAPPVDLESVKDAISKGTSVLSDIVMPQGRMVSMPDGADGILLNQDFNYYPSSVATPERVDSFGIEQNGNEIPMAGIDVTRATRDSRYRAFPARVSTDPQIPSSRNAVINSSERSQLAIPSNSPSRGDKKAEVYEVDIPSDLESGHNVEAHTHRGSDKQDSNSPTPFYVIISVKGISKPHAALRVVSKAISVGVFAAGTATFASATLITISVALTTLCLVLAVGVFGRVTALWMASEMMKTDPVLHRVLNDRGEAGQYISEMLKRRGLTFEFMGNVIIDGRCVHKYNTWFRWSTLFGILARPFDVERLARYNRR